MRKRCHDGSSPRTEVRQWGRVRANTSLSFTLEGAYGIGKYRVNRLNIKGMESIEKIKLARIN
jgi:hypothetical protein